MKTKLVDGMYGIKMVWPGWFEDQDADKRVGYPPRYNERFDIPIGAKMFIYVTEYQRIMAINKVTGTWEEGKRMYSPSGRFPLCLPIYEEFKAQTGLSLREVQQIVPRLKPHQGMSYFPISYAEYQELEKCLLQMG